MKRNRAARTGIVPALLILVAATIPASSSIRSAARPQAAAPARQAAVPGSTPAMQDAKSAFLAAGLAREKPAFALLSVDSLGGGRLDINPVLKEDPAPGPASPLRFETGGRGEFVYGAAGSDGRIVPLWRVSFSEKTIVLRSEYAPGIAPLPFLLAIDQKRNHATLLGRMKPGERRMALPCVLHLPDMGSLRIVANAPGLALDYDARRYVPKPFVKVAFRAADAARPRVEYTLEVAAIYPGLKGVESDPRYDGFRRSFLNLFQVNPRVQMLANNASSDPVPFTLYMDALMAAAWTSTPS
jgi:hypothetical protein